MAQTANEEKRRVKVNVVCLVKRAIINFRIGARLLYTEPGAVHRLADNNSIIKLIIITSILITRHRSSVIIFFVCWLSDVFSAL